MSFQRSGLRIWNSGPLQSRQLPGTASFKMFGGQNRWRIGIMSVGDLANHDSDSTELGERSNPGASVVHASSVTQRSISPSTSDIKCREKGCRTRNAFHNESDFKSLPRDFRFEASLT